MQVRGTLEVGKKRLADLGSAQEAAEGLAAAIATGRDIPSVEFLLYTALQTIGAPLTGKLPVCLRNYDVKQVFAFIKGTQGLPLRLIALCGVEKHAEAANTVKAWLDGRTKAINIEETVRLLGETVQIGTGLKLPLLTRTAVTPIFQALDLVPFLLSIWQTRNSRLCREVLTLGYFCSMQSLVQAVSRSFQATFASKSVSESIEEALSLDPLFPDCPEISFALRKSLAEKLNTSEGIREFSGYFDSLLVKGCVPSQVKELFLLVANKDLFEQLYRKDALLRVLEGSNTEMERDALEAISALAPPGLFQRSRALLLDLSLSEGQR